jgi:hypothetical protein
MKRCKSVEIPTMPPITPAGNIGSHLEPQFITGPPRIRKTLHNLLQRADYKSALHGAPVFNWASSHSQNTTRPLPTCRLKIGAPWNPSLQLGSYRIRKTLHNLFQRADYKSALHGTPVYNWAACSASQIVAPWKWLNRRKRIVWM